MHSRNAARGALRLAVMVGGLCWALTVRSSGQAPPVPAPTPGEPPTLPQALAPAPASGDSVAELREQIRQLEALMRAGAERQEALEARLYQMEAAGYANGSGPAGMTSGGMTSGGMTAGGMTAGGMTSGGMTSGGMTSGGISTPGTAASAPSTGAGFGDDELTRGGAIGLSPTAPLEAVADMPPPPTDYTPKIKVGPGFQISDEDEEFVIQFHNLTQFDGRFYEQGGQQTTRDTFAFPRQWFIFNGRVGKPYEYYVAFAQGFDNLNLLDTFLNVHYDDRFQVKLGRYKTPFTYEFYSVPIQGLPTPERSLFFNNFGLNRTDGAMAWGQLYDGAIDYAAGIFNSSRNSLLDLQDDKNFAGLVNVRPFKPLGIDALEFFNVGGSVNVGHMLQPQLPLNLRVEVPTTGNQGIGVPFLVFNPGVLESGTRALWSLHAAWYYRQLSLIAEWQSGYQNFALSDAPLDRTQVGVQSFYVWAGYFLTGETVETRGMVEPLRPFDLRRGKRGPGAFELVGRYNYLDIGDDIFTGGFSDPANWTDRLYTIDVGMNWYWNQYVKVFAGWEHVVFADPVLYRTTPTDEFQLTSDLFWFRFQVYF